MRRKLCLVRRDRHRRDHRAVPGSSHDRLIPEEGEVVRAATFHERDCLRESAGQMDSEGVARFATRSYWRIKRVCDVLLAFPLIIVLVPLFAVTAMVVCADVGLPVLFWQQRPGLGGRPFRVYKFRTMATHTDRTGLKGPDEWRISALGHFLRRTRADELPQLVNILRGDMSFVGPRPLLATDQANGFAARLLVRPGLTGWAQVQGGRGLSPRDKAALDLWYICNASIWLDLRILAATVLTLLGGERANAKAIVRAWIDLERLGLWRAQRGSSGFAPGE